MSEFKKFTEAVLCDVVPITRDRKVYLQKNVVSEDDSNAVKGDKHFEVGETYLDFVSLKAANFAELSDGILQELYACGFSTRSYDILDDGTVQLEYSFLTNEPWRAMRSITAIVYGDITAENDHRRRSSCTGEWVSYAELQAAVGSNQAHKIFERISG